MTRMTTKELCRKFRQWQKQPAEYEECTDMHRCCNCEREFRGNYCPACGQKWDTGPVSWSNLRQQWMNLWGLGTRSLPVTILQLFLRHLVDVPDPEPLQSRQAVKRGDIPELLDPADIQMLEIGQLRQRAQIRAAGIEDLQILEILARRQRTRVAPVIDCEDRDLQIRHVFHETEIVEVLIVPDIQILELCQIFHFLGVVVG